MKLNLGQDSFIELSWNHPDERFWGRWSAGRLHAFNFYFFSFWYAFDRTSILLHEHQAVVHELQWKIQKLGEAAIIATEKIDDLIRQMDKLQHDPNCELSVDVPRGDEECDCWVDWMKDKIKKLKDNQ